MKPLKLLFAIATFLFTTSLCAQQVVSTSGGEAEGTGGSVSYSVGQPVYITKTAEDHFLIEGVQQPYEISEVMGVSETDISWEISAYPNPTTSVLTIQVDYLNTDALTLQLCDEGGKVVLQEKVLSSTTELQLGELSRATYYLSMLDSGHPVKTVKIIKL